MPTATTTSAKRKLKKTVRTKAKRPVTRKTTAKAKVVRRKKVTKAKRPVTRKTTAKAKVVRRKKVVKTKRPPRKTVKVRKPRRPAMTLERNSKRPYDRHLLPDVEEMDPKNLAATTRRRRRKGKTLRKQPVAARAVAELLNNESNWSSVVLFFNLPAGQRPADYKRTWPADAERWLEIRPGAKNASSTVSSFMREYWRTLSYGKFHFGVGTIIDDSVHRLPVVPEIKPPKKNAKDWVDIALKFFDQYAEKIWRAAGGLTRDGKRYVPSIVLIHNYYLQATATTWGYDRTVDGRDYAIGRMTHIPYDLTWLVLTGVPSRAARKIWGTLCHEYGHNFLTYGDLYTPSGCTGYWDLLGDNSPPGRMSEVCSYFKERVGWINWKEVIKGRKVAKRQLSLRPYTTTGEAYKVVPDPVNNPQEFFLLEYRKKTGNEVWRPDRVLTEEGLLIIHINERLGGVAWTWLAHEAPFFDVVHADYDKDKGAALWTGHDDTEGALFPRNGKKTFSVWTKPSSDFYGGLRSGLRIRDIKVSNNRVHFSLSIDCETRRGWTIRAKDRITAGRFTTDAREEGIAEVFIRNDNESALLLHREGQWLIQRFDRGRIGQWDLRAQDRELAADLDGDGRDEIFIRSNNWAGVLKWDRHQFRTIEIQEGWIGGWNLGRDNWELAADFNGDGRKQIYTRSPEWAGVFEFRNNNLRLQSIHHRKDHAKIWSFKPNDKEYVGQFTHRNKDMILAHRDDRLAILAWRQDVGLVATYTHKGNLSGWPLHRDDKICVGDFDGDGHDELFIRNANKAAMLKFVRNKFGMLWLSTDSIVQTDMNRDSLPLTPQDRCFAGAFRPNKSGIFHYGKDHAALLLFEKGKGFRARFVLDNPVSGLWEIDRNDKIALGDFHPLGRDRARSIRDFVGDHVTDVFLLNSQKSGMIGVNYTHHKSEEPWKFREDMGVTWVRDRNFLLAWL